MKGKISASGKSQSKSILSEGFTTWLLLNWKIVKVVSRSRAELRNILAVVYS